MGIGEPDFVAPPSVMEAATRAMAEGNICDWFVCVTHSDFYALSGGVWISVASSRIVVTAGASAALLLACAALVEKEAEVLMPDPCYPCNRHFVAAFEGRAKLIPSGPADRFQLSDTMVREHWSEATAGVLLASPSNQRAPRLRLPNCNVSSRQYEKRAGSSS